MTSPFASAKPIHPACVKLVVPELFANDEFKEYLKTSPNLMTWHEKGTEIYEDDWNDTTIFVDPTLSGEGTNSDMPFHDDLVELLKKHFGGPLPPFSPHIVVVLTAS